MKYLILLLVVLAPVVSAQTGPRPAYLHNDHPQGAYLEDIEINGVAITHGAFGQKVVVTVYSNTVDVKASAWGQTAEGTFTFGSSGELNVYWTDLTLLPAPPKPNPDDDDDDDEGCVAGTGLTGTGSVLLLMVALVVMYRRHTTETPT